MGLQNISSDIVLFGVGVDIYDEDGRHWDDGHITMLYCPEQLLLCDVTGMMIRSHPKIARRFVNYYPDTVYHLPALNRQRRVGRIQKAIFQSNLARRLYVDTF